MPQFDTTTYSSQIFWLFVNFLLLSFFVSKIFYPRIKIIFQKRTKILQDNLAGIDHLTSEKDKLVNEASENLSNARMNAGKIIRETSEKLEKNKMKTIKALEEEILKKSKIIFNNLDALKENEASGIPSQAADITKLIMERILPKPIAKTIISQSSAQETLDLAITSYKKYLNYKES